MENANGINGYLCRWEIIWLDATHSITTRLAEPELDRTTVAVGMPIAGDDVLAPVEPLRQQGRAKASDRANCR
jgi:hypothetical protein